MNETEQIDSQNSIIQMQNSKNYNMQSNIMKNNPNQETDNKTIPMQSTGKQSNESNTQKEINDRDDYDVLLKQLPDNSQKEIGVLEEILTNKIALRYLMKKSLSDECPVSLILTNIVLIMENAEQKKDESLQQKTSNNFLSFLDNPNLFMAIMFLSGMIIAVIYMLLNN